MKIFSKLYNLVTVWAEHKHAQYYLGGVSFAESSFFPIPPDVMLLPMSVTNPQKAWYFAFVTTVASVLGAILGYFLGYFLFDSIGLNIIDSLHLSEKFELVKEIFQKHGAWYILIAAFTPLPYKLFTLAAGALSVSLLPFIIASIIGRGLRFFLVAAISKWFGKKYKDKLPLIIDYIAWSVLGLILLIALVYYFAK